MTLHEDKVRAQFQRRGAASTVEGVAARGAASMVEGVATRAIFHLS